VLSGKKKELRGSPEDCVLSEDADGVEE